MSARALSGGFGLLLAIGGLIAWASAFVLLYVVVSLGCVYGWHGVAIAGFNLLTLILLLIWLAHLAAIVWLGWYGLSRWRRIRDAGETGAALYLAFVTGLVAIVSLVGTVYLGAPVLVLPPCA